MDSRTSSLADVLERVRGVNSGAAALTGRGLCAYGITRGRQWDRIAFPGLHSGASPMLVNRDGIGLVVADADLMVFGELGTEPADDSLLATLVREHDAVVRAVFEQEAVLPLRFGTIVTDRTAARQLLADRHEEASTWLDRVTGHREWGLRVEYENPAETVVTGQSAPHHPRSHPQELAGRRKRVSVVQSLHGELSRLATSSINRERPRALLDAAYLVHQGDEEKFRSAAAWLCDEVQQLGASVHATGPWPPYSFTRLPLAMRG